MIELLLLAGGILGAGMGGMWVKTRRRTNRGNTRVAVDRFEDASRRVSSSQARWFDLQNEATIAKGGLSVNDSNRLNQAVDKAERRSRDLYEAWLPISDEDGESVASYNDQSRMTVTEHKQKALTIVAAFEQELDELEEVLDDLRT